ncbi:MAG: Ig-like domain-containing protein [Bacteroidetes bacterium]|nr:Ig-like domain-containing protein [Bacteroidota bacterium]
MAVRKLYKYILIVIFVTSTIGRSQSHKVEAGYFINPVETPFGIVLTDEYESAIYLLDGSMLTVLTNSPGCGRYLSFSKDMSLIGFKKIDENTQLQTPAIYNLKTNQIQLLAEPTSKAGQVSFSYDGAIAFTYEQSLVIIKDGKRSSFNLGLFSNRAPISPDGNFVIFKDNDDQLWKHNLYTEVREMITDNQNGYYNAKWSPNGEYIICESVNAQLFIYHDQSKEFFKIDDGENARWSSDSKNIVYHKRKIDFYTYELIESDIYIFNVASREEKNLTLSPAVFEMDASFSNNDEVLFHTFNTRELHRKNISGNSDEQLLYKMHQPLPVYFYELKAKESLKKKSINEIDWVHIHQVFDSRDSGSWTKDPVNGRHQGYLSCGATSAMQVLASYKILLPKPITTYGHVSNYGIYLSDSYTHNGFTFSGFNITPPSNPGFYTGAHGFMWNNGSPYSNTVSFLGKHGVEASRTDNVTWSKVMNEINLGYPHILCTTSLTSSHIVLAIKQYGDQHSLYFNDPYGDKNAGSYGAIYNGKNAIYDWADANTGHIKVTPVVWAVTARYNITLPLVSSYPQNNQSDVSISAEICLQFYGELDSNSFVDKFYLTDESLEEIDFTVDFSFSQEGKVIIIPRTDLQPEKKYSFTVKNGIMDVDGLAFADEQKIEFFTEREREITGEVLNDFEYTSGYSLLYSGVDNPYTKLSLSGEKSHDGFTSAKLDYKYNTSSTGYCRILFNPEPNFGSDEFLSVGLWVFGDNNKNNLEFWISDANGAISKYLEKQINWSGWKFIDIPVSEINNSIKTFNCVAIRQSSGGINTGKLYFDNLIVIKTPTSIANCVPQNNAVDIELNANIELTFNKPMNKESVENSISVSPSCIYQINWSSDSKTLTLTGSELKGKTLYFVEIDTSAEDISGMKLKEKFITCFTTKRVNLLIDNYFPKENSVVDSKQFDVLIKMDGPLDQTSLPGNVLFTDSENNPVDIIVDRSVYNLGWLKFEPRNPLQVGREYKITLKPGIKDSHNLTFGNQKIIVFSISHNKYETGIIIDSVETISDWSISEINIFNSNVNYEQTDISLNSTKKISGNNSCEIKYEFASDQGILFVSKPLDNVTASSNFGFWLYGDLSCNKIHLYFETNAGEVIKVFADSIGYTGWKLINILPKDYTVEPLINFIGIAIESDFSGENFGSILIDDFQTDIVLVIAETWATVPNKFELFQNYPNPFNPRTIIKFSIAPVETRHASSLHVQLRVYDLLGREIQTLVNEQKSPGTYEVVFDGSNLSSGTYFYKLKSGSNQIVKKMIIIK